MGVTHYRKIDILDRDGTVAILLSAPMNARVHTPIRPEGGRVYVCGYTFFAYRFITGTSG